MTRGPLASAWTIKEMMHKSELTMHSANDKSGREKSPPPSCLHFLCDRFPFICREALPLS